MRLNLKRRRSLDLLGGRAGESHCCSFSQLPLSDAAWVKPSPRCRLRAELLKRMKDQTK